MDFEVKQEPVEIDGYLLVCGTSQRNFDSTEESVEHNEASSSKKRKISDDENSSFLHPDELNIQDCEMQLLLQQWGLEVLSDRFAKNLIDVSVLDYIVDVDIIDLCKDLPIRYRLVLRHELKQKSYARRKEPHKTPPETVDKRKTTANYVPLQRDGSFRDALLIDTPVPKTHTTPPEIVRSSSQVDLTLDDITTLRNLNLLEICERYKAGRKFLAEYKTENGKKNYTSESRTNIKIAMVEHFFRLGKGHISKQSFRDMVRIILKELPDEDPRIWYSTAEQDSTQKGILYTRYRYLQQHDKRFRRKRGSIMPTVPHATVVSNNAIQNWNRLSDHEQAACMTAKSNLNDDNFTSDDVEVVSAWNACFPLRRYEAVTGKLQLEEWAVLSTYGDVQELINSDFNTIHQRKTEPIDDRVVNYVDRFKCIYLSYKSLIEEDKLLISAIWMAAGAGFGASEKNIFLALYVLPLILRQNTVIRDNKRYKPTLRECRSAFITLLESEDNVPETIEQKRRFSREHNTPIHPYIIAIGSVSHEISRYFVILDNIILKRRTIISALDLLFKVHTVFHLEYSVLCKNVLDFIQLYFYDLKFAGDQNFVCVTALITDLNRRASTIALPNSSTDSCQTNRLDNAAAPETPAQNVAQYRATNVTPTWHGFNLLDICKEHESGRKFLDHYRIVDGKKFYSANCRVYIKLAILDYFFVLRQGRINMHDFLEMTQIIINELPDEDPRIWYTPGNEDPAQRRYQKGLLYSRYRYMQKHDHRFRRKKETVLPQHSTVVSDHAKQGWDGLSESEQAVCLAAKSKLMNMELTNKTEILHAWKECFPLRRYEAVTGKLDLEEWTVLSTCEAFHELVDSDFSCIHSAKTEGILGRVLEYVKRFKSIFQGYKTLFEEDKLLKDTIVSAIAEGFEPTEKNIFLALYVLPLILRLNFVVKGRIRIKPSRWECRNSFITILESEDQVTQTIEENIRVATDYNLEPRPFIIAIGYVTHDISRYLVVLGTQIFKCETIVTAVELLFKLYTVFHLEYSNLCEGVLKFIQSYLFELVFDGELLDTAVAALTTDLNRI